jgi:YVTN family beta-propeller protein
MRQRAAVVLCVTAALMGPGSLDGAAAGTPAAGLSSRPDALVYIANLHSDTVSVVDTGTGMVVDSVPVGDGPDSVAVSPDGSRVYVTNSASDTVSVIDARTRTVIATVAVGDEPSRVTISPDNRNVYVANVGSVSTSEVGCTDDWSRLRARRRIAPVSPRLGGCPYLRRA